MKVENSEDSFCMFLDLETGGFNPKVHGICEIGFLVFNTRTNEIVSKSVFKIKPYFILPTVKKVAEYTEKALKVNGHSVEDLKVNGFSIINALTVFDAVITKYRVEYFGGHNLKNFDLKFIDWVYRNYLKKEFKYKDVVCTLAMSRKRLDLKSYSLVSLCEHFKIGPKNYHTAMADTEASYEVFQLLRNLKMK